MTIIDLSFQARGRVDLVEFHKGKNYTIVTTPAPDEFSHPSRFKIISDAPFGQPGQTVDFTAVIKGSVKPKSYVESATGHHKTYQEADVYIHLVRAQLVYPQQQLDKKGA